MERRDEGGFNTPNDYVFYLALTTWAKFNGLRNVKKVIDFACGLASTGIVLSKEYTSIIYHGFDDKKNIVEAANKALADYPNAKVFCLDMVTGTVNETYDAALDTNGLDMLHEKNDREAYLKNAYNCLRSSAPMLFFFQPFCSGKRKTKAEYESEISSSRFYY